MTTNRVRRLLVLDARRAHKVIVVACGLCLIALALIVWSLFSPTVLSVMVAMSVGQALGTVSLVLYLWAVIADLLRARVLGEKRDE